MYNIPEEDVEVEDRFLKRGCRDDGLGGRRVNGKRRRLEVGSRKCNITKRRERK